MQEVIIFIVGGIVTVSIFLVVQKLREITKFLKFVHEDLVRLINNVGANAQLMNENTMAIKTLIEVFRNVEKIMFLPTIDDRKGRKGGAVSE